MLPHVYTPSLFHPFLCSLMFHGPTMSREIGISRQLSFAHITYLRRSPIWVVVAVDFHMTLQLVFDDLVTESTLPPVAFRLVGDGGGARFGRIWIEAVWAS